MAKKTRTTDQGASTDPGADGPKTPGASSGSGNGQGESIQGYFRRLFQENPRLLKSRSNEELLERWLNDHPGHTEVPKQVKSGLANLKSVLRSKQRQRKGRQVEEQPEESPAPQAQEPVSPPAEGNPLEQLEEQIDECLTLARNLDRTGLESVIQLLRRARNEVVWKVGQ
jgi:hypothetical protein